MSDSSAIAPKAGEPVRETPGTSQSSEIGAPSTSTQIPSNTGARPTEKSKDKKPQSVPKVGSAPSGEADSKLSGKELKLKKQQEKQAKRAQEKAAQGAGEGSVGPSQNGALTAPKQAKGRSSAEDSQGKPNQPQVAQLQQQAQPHHRRTGSQSQAQRPIPVRRRNSQSNVSKPPRKPTKEVGLFGHLYGLPRRTALDGIPKEVHPAVLSLGIQLSNYTICGSSARCVAMLLAFKTAISSYTTPPTTSLARHLSSHYLSPQIEYLKSRRPLSVSMGNAIRWLKDYIIHIDPDTPDIAAKADLAEAIDTFIRERITVADAVIAGTAAGKIRHGMRIVTYAKSSIVEQTLLAAQAEGKRFSVVCVDSRPLFEGRNLVRRLVKAGIEATYVLLPAVAHVLKDADLVLLGAHAMMANGRLYSRVGTACVAMSAKGRDVPVIVLSESIKFTDRVALDSIVLNEVAPSEELVEREEVKVVEAGEAKKDEGKGKKGKEEKEDENIQEKGLAGWREKDGLQLLNIMYDVTPAEYVDMVITEYGNLPPSSVPVVHRISTERDVRA